MIVVVDACSGGAVVAAAGTTATAGGVEGKGSYKAAIFKSNCFFNEDCKDSNSNFPGTTRHTSGRKMTTVSIRAAVDDG